MDKYLNIVSFNVPYPANYGGIIDVFYKLKALYQANIKIILHCFEYGRQHAPELEKWCEKVYYYPRATGIKSNFTWLPYNVYSRKSDALIQNLLSNPHPILFEGLHSCYYLPDKRLKNRIKIYRESNIEHDYFNHLGKAEHAWKKKFYYHIEAFRFKCYEKTLKHSNMIFTVSQTDTQYLQNKFPSVPVHFIPSFHPNDTMASQLGMSENILYHGNLSVIENEKAALYLIENVFCKINSTCMIAGLNPSEHLRKVAASYTNVHLIANPAQRHMDQLVKNAQVNILVTFQPTGLKLKLLNTLFNGKHIVVNDLMLTGSGLDSTCHIANTPQEQVAMCNQLLKKEFDEQAIRSRQAVLVPTYSNPYQAKRIVRLIFDEK